MRKTEEKHIMDETNVDALLRQELSQSQLADTYAEKISPFKDAVFKVIAGLILTAITLQFFKLQYILPQVGYLLLYLGMRTLRRTNSYFKISWILSILLLIQAATYLLVNATPYLYQLPSWLQWVSILLDFVFLYCFGKGIQKVNDTAGTKKKMIPTLPVILWKAILIPLALIQFQNFVFVILMFVAYIFTIKYIYHCADGLEYAGYDVPAAPVRISGGRLMLIYVLAILLGITGFTWGFGYVDLTTQAEPAETLQMSLTRQTLIQQGFPEDALNQIQEDDLQGIKDVKGVYVDEENTDDQFMKASIIAVHNGDGRVKWFIPFVYKENEHSVLVDSIKIFCDSDTRSEGGTGVISYAKKGKAYQVRIPLDTETKERIWFGDVNEDRTLNAKYSFPLFSKEQKGYFTYWSGSAGDTPYTFGICSATFYCQRNYFVLPYVKLPYQSSSMDIFQSGFGDRMGEYRNQVYTTIELQTEETETT